MRTLSYYINTIFIQVNLFEGAITPNLMTRKKIKKAKEFRRKNIRKRDMFKVL